MAEDKKIAAAAPHENSPAELVVTLERPYIFEGTEYKEIDLGGLAKMTVQDAIDAQRRLFTEKEVAGLMIAETTTAFARILAQKASGLPIEFFKLAPRRVSRAVEQVVRGALNAQGETKNHIMALDAPYVFEGRTYTEIDLNGIDDLNSLNESEAENALVRDGFIITESSFNYLYACVIAGMATGRATEFYTGLPLRETVKLKNAVNDESFFA